MACNGSLYEQEQFVCAHCFAEAAKTHTHLQKENFVERKFHGKIPILFAWSFLYFHQKGIAQRIIHFIKYKNGGELAVEMGLRYGVEIKEALKSYRIDYLVPVPLNYKKLKKRGYNQSDKICEGLGTALGIPVADDALIRTRATDTQTRKGRIQRWENVRDIFRVNGDTIEGKRVIIVDDVITTGSTVESCAQALLDSRCEVGVLSLAVAK